MESPCPLRHFGEIFDGGATVFEMRVHPYFSVCSPWDVARFGAEKAGGSVIVITQQPLYLTKLQRRDDDHQLERPFLTLPECSFFIIKNTCVAAF